MIDLSTVKELRALRLPGMARNWSHNWKNPSVIRRSPLRTVWLFS